MIAQRGVGPVVRGVGPEVLVGARLRSGHREFRREALTERYLEPGAWAAHNAELLEREQMNWGYRLLVADN